MNTKRFRIERLILVTLLVLGISCTHAPNQKVTNHLGLRSIRSFQLLNETNNEDGAILYTVYAHIKINNGIVSHDLLIHGGKSDSERIQQRLYKYSNAVLDDEDRHGNKLPFQLTVFEDGRSSHLGRFKNDGLRKGDFFDLGLFQIVLEILDFSTQSLPEIALHIYDSSGKLHIYKMELTSLENSSLDHRLPYGKEIWRVKIKDANNQSPISYLVVNANSTFIPNNDQPLVYH
jgi:hypothetical protein